jgi:flavin-dependent dehydrogenase
MLIGDAAGLAYPESGEGIRTAVNSGLTAARTLLGARDRRREDLLPYERAVRPAQPASATLASKLPRRMTRALGRWALANPTFTRRVVLDRWFLHASSSRPAGLTRAA